MVSGMQESQTAVTVRMSKSQSHWIQKIDNNELNN